MIIGIALRNFKVYKNIHYIPLSNGVGFTGIIGRNGIGKSSLLEALDCYFNDRKWIPNIDSKADESWIMPLFALEKDCIRDENLKSYAQKITDCILSEDEPPDAIAKKNHWNHILKLRNSIPEKFKDNSFYLLPISREKSESGLSLGIFDGFSKTIFSDAETDDSDYYDDQDDAEDSGFTETKLSILNGIYELLREEITYIYVPSDIQPEEFIAFENRDLQRLMGGRIREEMASVISKDAVKEISHHLKSFIVQISGNLNGYKFRAPGSQQPNLKPQKIYELIMEQFFSLRMLHKCSDGRELPLRELSSGEKQQAIIKVITSLVTKVRESANDLIIAIDEPESSLHISNCFEQFENLIEVSRKCNQVFVTSHWYGFMPIITDGAILYLSHNEAEPYFLFNAEKFREEIVHQVKASLEPLPIDVMIKSTNDLVQSILSSLIADDYYNWIICEGSSDKIYLSAYFDDLIREKHLRILPAGAAKEVKKLYYHLAVSLEELKSSAKGRVFMLTDTDMELVTFKTDYPVGNKLICQRLVNHDGDTKLVDIGSNLVVPTEIEQTLNGRVFYKTLLDFRPDNDELAFIDSITDVPEIPSGYALNLRQSDSDSLDQFFNKNSGHNKIAFANSYVAHMHEGEYSIPNWIQEIRNFITHAD